MAVDLDAIARRGHCDVSALKNALNPLEQGYSPSFLARYRRDELGGVDEASLWSVAAGLALDNSVEQQRTELLKKWQETSLADPAIGAAIQKSHSKRMLLRLARRLKKEDGATVSDSDRLAVRLLNPAKGDPAEISELCALIEGVDASAAEAGLDKALAERLSGDPRVIDAAVRWLAKNAKIHVAGIQDPHTGEDSGAATETKSKAQANKDDSKPDDNVAGQEQPADNTPTAEAAPAPSEPTERVDAVAAEATTASPDATAESTDTAAAATEDAKAQTEAAPTAAAPTAADETPATTDDAAAPAAEATTTEPASADATTTKQDEAAPKKQTAGNPKAGGKAKQEPKKKSKKISPRQRRRRWLVSVLKPLEGKRLIANKVSAFQIVMLGRALRSQVATCIFEYDANKLVGEIQKSVGGINRKLETKLQEIVLEHEANIREAAETAWWDELHERASAKLLGIAADQLREHINRGAVEANVVMSIDAVGPRTAATTIVAADGRVLHCEDLPCQISGALRAQAVNKMGELIHTQNVDLIVISNGPARRSCMIALSDLIKQSPEGSIRYTLADRSGADSYASSDVANQEMRSTPRRFRASAWLAFSVLQPAQAYAKIDPLKLRLASFQRELSDDALSAALENVMVGGASRGGVDVNSASPEWLARLPGMNREAAKKIDQQRRQQLWDSRSALLESEVWDAEIGARQAIPFLRVFGSEEVLDGTLIHPDDYPLAKKLAKTLGIELPPACPPGYETPNFEEAVEPAAEPNLAAEPTEPAPAEVQDVSAAVEQNAPTSFAEDVKLEATDEPKADADDSSEPSTEQPEASAESTPEETPSAETTSEDAASTGDSPEASSDDEPASAPEPEAPTDQPAEPQAGSESADQPTPNPVPEQVRRPRPERAQVDKCIKEWQVGKRRVNQLVNWLCDPFGDSDVSSRPPAVLKGIPTLKQLKQGDEVIGVVVGVVGFGVFVELAPDCNGLIHVSKVSDRYVEDLHEAIQVGDVITMWVTGIDEKKRRVALSAISPEREQELQRQRENARGTRGGGRGGDGRGRRGGSGSDQRAGRSGGGGGQSQARGGGGGGQGRGRGGAGGGKPRSDRGGGRGRDRDNRGGGRGRGKKPESYRVVGKAVAAPISDAMQKGDEPLRSFGDLMQFYKKEEPVVEQPAAESKPKPDDAPPAAETPVETKAADTEKTPDVPVEPSPASEPVQSSQPPTAESTDAPPSDSSESE